MLAATCAGALEFGRQRDIDEVAGDGDMVRPLAAKVAGDGVERAGAWW